MACDTKLVNFNILSNSEAFLTMSTFYQYTIYYQKQRSDCHTTNVPFIVKIVS